MSETPPLLLIVSHQHNKAVLFIISVTRSLFIITINWKQQ